MDFIQFNSGGFVLGEIPVSLREYITQEIQRARKNKISYNHRLIGHIKEEYEIADIIQNEDFLKCILKLVTLYNKEYPLYQETQNILVKDGPFAFAPPWVNFQKKGEFNPPHSHSGIYSYVIWVDIPYDIEDENKVFQTSSNQSHNGKFVFLHSNALGEITTHFLDVDRTWNWRIALFPSKLNHMVNPFFSTHKERVSIAGNILIANESL